MFLVYITNSKYCFIFRVNIDNFGNIFDNYQKY
jgi:hypothetical protein